MGGQARDACVGLGIPDTDHAVASAGDEQWAPLGPFEPGHRGDGGLVAGQADRVGPAGGGPDQDTAVSGGGGQATAVGRECDRAHLWAVYSQPPGPNDSASGQRSFSERSSVLGFLSGPTAKMAPCSTSVM